MTALVKVPKGFIEYLKQKGITSKKEVEALFVDYMNQVYSTLSSQRFSKDFDLNKLLLNKEGGKEVTHLFI